MQGPLPLQIEKQSWVDWCLRGQMSFLQVTTNHFIIVSSSLSNGYNLRLNKNRKRITLTMDYGTSYNAVGILKI